MKKICFDFEQMLIWSDLHLDYNYSNRQIKKKFDTGEKWHNLKIPSNKKKYKNTLLLLGGDIVNGDNIYLLESFLKELIQIFGFVVMIPGNHEYYYSKYDEINKYLETIKYDNFYLLMNDSIEFTHPFRTKDNKIVIYGSTMWSNLEDEYQTEKIINVFEKDAIKMDGKYLSLEEYMKCFKESYKSLKKFVKNFKYDENTKVIILTHYALTSDFVPKKFENHPLNCLFHSNIKEIFNYPLYMVICGHVHERMMFKRNNVICRTNPRGYPDEETDFKIDDYILI